MSYLRFCPILSTPGSSSSGFSSVSASPIGIWPGTQARRRTDRSPVGAVAERDVAGLARRQRQRDADQIGPHRRSSEVVSVSIATKPCSRRLRDPVSSRFRSRTVSYCERSTLDRLRFLWRVRRPARRASVRLPTLRSFGPALSAASCGRMLRLAAARRAAGARPPCATGCRPAARSGIRHRSLPHRLAASATRFVSVVNSIAFRNAISARRRSSASTTKSSSGICTGALSSSSTSRLDMRACSANSIKRLAPLVLLDARCAR